MILNNQRSPKTRNNITSNKVLLIFISNQVASGFTSQNVEAGNAKSMVMIEHQTCGLLIGIVERHRAIAWIFHIRNVGDADSLRVRSIFTSGGYPLMGSTITDPGSATTVKMNGGTVLGVKFAAIWLFKCVVTLSTTRSQWSRPCAHNRLVNRNKQIATFSNWQVISKLQTDRAIFCGENDWAHIVVRWRRNIRLHVATHASPTDLIGVCTGHREIRVHWLLPLCKTDLVII